MESTTAVETGQLAPPTPLPPGWLSRWPWVTFVLPLVVFMLVGSLEPKPPKTPAMPTAAGQALAGSESSDPLAGIRTPDEPKPADDEAAEATSDKSWLPAIPYRYYPAVYTAKIVLTIVAMLLVWPGYRTFPWRVSGLAFTVGAVGAVIWVGLCKLHLEPTLLGPLGLGGLVDMGQRSAFNPLAEFPGNPALAYGFLAIRFFGLVAVVPVIEEFFLRGFLMRAVMHDQWTQIPFGAVNRAALVAGTAVPMLMHPGELLAAAAWFSLVTWLMLRNRNIWDCVTAHAVTNLLMGVWVLASGDWWLM